MSSDMQAISFDRSLVKSDIDIDRPSGEIVTTRRTQVIGGLRAVISIQFGFSSLRTLSPRHRFLFSIGIIVFICLLVFISIFVDVVCILISSSLIQSRVSLREMSSNRVLPLDFNYSIQRKLI